MYFNRCVIFSNSQEKSKNIYDKLISQDYPAMYLTSSLTTAQPDDNYRIIVAYDSRIVRKKMDLEKINLVINFDIPTNTKKLVLNIGCTGQHGYFGIAICLCNSTDFENLKFLCENLNVTLSLLPKEINPEYFYYIYNPESINSIKVDLFTSNNTISTPVISNNKKLLLQKGFNFPFIPEQTFLVNTQKSMIDLSPAAIQQFLLDQGEDEEDWFAEELKSLSTHTSNNYESLPLGDLILLKAKHLESLGIPDPVLDLSHLMETETWEHPPHKSVSSRIELWRKSVFNVNKHLYNIAQSSELSQDKSSEKEKRKENDDLDNSGKKDEQSG